MIERATGRLCSVAAVLVLLGGVLIWAVGGTSVGLRLDAGADGRPVVTDVTLGSLAWSAGARPGMIVTHDFGLLLPTITDVPIGQQLRLVDERRDEELEIGQYAALVLVPPALLGGVAVLFIAWLIRTRHPRHALAPFIAPLALATTTPLALVPAAAFGSPVTLALGALLWPLSVVPLAAAISAEAPDAPTGRAAVRAAGVAVAAALGLVPLLFVLPALGTGVAVLREGLVAAALLVPLALIARARLAGHGPWTLSSEPLVHALGLTAVAATPLVMRLALALPSAGIAVLLIVLWLVAGATGARYVVAPLSALTTRALRQRDLVGATAEAERRRLAIDLHDGPIQSLTLLAYRLDAVGDAENAGFTRDVVTELRAVTSSLRLPVIDDLGAGAALEWLTGQAGRLSGLPIEFERVDSGRPPLEVEHAVFRVAQEALANAMRHGRPPIRVRYEADRGRANLMVDDAGAGLTDGLALANGESGLGLIGMRERAHSIGAELELRGSTAGSRVSLVWPAAVP